MTARPDDPPIADPHAWRRLDLAAITSLADEETPWRCRGIAADGFLTVLAGRGGEGKSLITLALAAGVLQGAPIAGIECSKGTVAIFDAENGPKLIGRRLKSSGIPHAGLAVYDADGLDLAADSAWISAQLADVQLAVFDSLRTLAAGAKENDSDDMAPRIVELRRLARQTGTAIVLVHHRGRESDKDFRGSSAILDQTDMLLVLERDAKDPEGRWRRCIRCAKCRIDEEPAPRWIGIKRQHGELFFTEAAPFTSKREAPTSDALSADAIQILTRDGGLRRADLARKLGREPSDSTVRRVVGTLQENGQIALIGDRLTVVTGPGDNNDNHSPRNASSNGQTQLVTSDATTPDHRDSLVSLSACHPPVGGDN